MPAQAIPISTHKERGTFRKHRHADKLALPAKRLGTAPAWFTEVMRGEWDRLRALPHIKAAHRATVEHACVLYGRFIEDAQGLEGFRPMAASERQTFHSLCMQLGGTPVTEAKCLSPQQPKQDDPWANL